jgi:hypothetical protein
MKYLFTIILMTTITTLAQTPNAKTEKKTFSRTTTVKANINSDLKTVWSILTNGSNYATWNSTIVSLEGDIKLNERIKLTSTLDSTRTFKLKVKVFEENSKLVWGDGLGERTFSITKTDEGVLFEMTETIGGFMFPLFANKIPSFDESFNNFAIDLKEEAERLYSKK